MRPHDRIPFIKAGRMILAGVALGIVTPARIGEYGGRLLTYDPDKKPQVISATLLGSIAQNLCNLLGGIAFSYLFLKSAIGVTYGLSYTFIMIVGLQMLFLILIYYNLPEVAHWIERKFDHTIIKRFSTRLKSLDLYQTPMLHKVLMISWLRYSVYFCQYIMMMKFCGVENKMIDLCGNIAGIYLIQTGIPLPAFLSVFARGEIAVLVWSTIGIDEVVALTATFGLWIINLIFPAALGIMVLSGMDLKKYLKTGKTDNIKT